MNFFDLNKKDEQKPANKKRHLSKRKLKKLVKLETKPSFRGLLIGSYVTFTLITFLSIILIFALANWLNRYETIDLSTAKLPDFVYYLRVGDYSKIPTVSIFGVDGWFEVVKIDGTSQYASNGKSHNFTKEELALLKKIGSNETITTQELVDDEGGKIYVITRSYESDGAIHNNYQILDEEYRVLTGDIGYNREAYTKSEYELLSYQSSHPDYVFAKYFFIADDGTPKYVVFLDTNDKINFKFEYIIGLTIAVAVIIYAVVMAIYIQYVNRNVQQPLTAISLAMKRFANEGNGEQIEYSGPLEFEQLANSFNEMVSLLNASEAEKQEIEKQRQSMLAGLSHDLKTPITIIQGFSKAIRDGVVADNEKQKYLDLIISKAELMGELINSFYEFSKLDHPDFVYNFERADVAELVRSHIAALYGEFSIRRYKLDANITEEQLFCMVDEPMMNRVIDNIVNNFFKYTPAGSTLFVEVKKLDNFAKISFADNGKGIPKEARKDIFEPFVVGEKSRNKQGSGLGLAVCKRIITAFNGDIVLNDAPKEGFTTQFDIMLPIVDIDNTI